MLAHWTHWFLRVECSTAQHSILCNRLLSLGLSSVIKTASASLASDFTHIPKDLVLWLNAKIPDAFYSCEVILPCSLVPVWTCSWDGTWPHVLCREQHLADKLEPSTDLPTWGATISTLPAAVERGPTARHHYTLWEYQGTFCFTISLLCWSHAASHSALSFLMPHSNLCFTYFEVPFCCLLSGLHCSTGSQSVGLYICHKWNKIQSQTS